MLDSPVDVSLLCATHWVSGPPVCPLARTNCDARDPRPPLNETVCRPVSPTITVSGANRLNRDVTAISCGSTMKSIPPGPGDHAGNELPSEFFSTTLPSATVEVRVIRAGNFSGRHFMGHWQNCPFGPD